MKNNESFFVGCTELKFADLDGKRWAQILKVGEYRHPLYGTFKITTDVLKRLAESFTKRVRNIDLAFNYEHGQSKAHGTRAAGWFRNVELRNDGGELWVNADWTPAGEKQIADKEFRYTSAEFFRRYTDAETGKVTDWVLKGAALTNTPFIKGMEAIAASELTKPRGKTEMKLSEITVLLHEEHGIDLRKLQADAAGYTDATANVTALTEENATLKADAKKLTKENADLTNKVEASEKAADDAAFAALVKQGMADGKLTKAFAEGKFSEMRDKMGVEFCTDYLRDAPTVVDLSEPTGDTGKGSDAGKTADIELTEKARARAKKDGISFSEAADLVLEENPVLAKAYEAMGR